MDKDNVPGFWEEKYEHEIGPGGVKIWKEAIKETITLKHAITRRLRGYKLQLSKEDINLKYPVENVHATIIIRCIRILLAGFRPDVKIQMLKDVQEIVEKRGR